MNYTKFSSLQRYSFFGHRPPVVQLFFETELALWEYYSNCVTVSFIPIVVLPFYFSAKIQKFQLQKNKSILL